MDLSAYQIALISGSFGIAGTLVGVLFTYRFATKLADTHAAHAARQAEVNASRAAAAKLRAAFAPVFARFKSYRIGKTFHDDIEPDTFLGRQLESQGIAIYEFLAFVPKSQWGSYEEAWQQCYQTEKDGVLVSSAHAREGKDEWSAIEDKIHAVLRFTET